MATNDMTTATTPRNRKHTSSEPTDPPLDDTHHNHFLDHSSEVLHHYLDPAHHAFTALTHKASDKVEEIAKKVWTVVHHHHLPAWLKDNEYLVRGHRPQLKSFTECFKSTFRIHTETGNIWTHLLGLLAFVGVALSYLLGTDNDVSWQEKVMVSMFFVGVILCLGFSCLVHMFCCHSEDIGKLFVKLDYCGIALLTMGSFVPWLHYSFYCWQCTRIVYTVSMMVLGTICIICSMKDKFAEPRYRALRAGTFIALGLSGTIPVTHYVISHGFWTAINFAALGQLALMAFLYISGAVIYACRIPEKIWPGKFDIWFQSHQIFHVFVVAAAFVHYHGISDIASKRFNVVNCLEDI